MNPPLLEGKKNRAAFIFSAILFFLAISGSVGVNFFKKNLENFSFFSHQEFNFFNGVFYFSKYSVRMWQPFMETGFEPIDINIEIYSAHGDGSTVQFVDSKQLKNLSKFDWNSRRIPMGFLGGDNILISQNFDEKSYIDWKDHVSDIKSTENGLILKTRAGKYIIYDHTDNHCILNNLIRSDIYNVSGEGDEYFAISKKYGYRIKKCKILQTFTIPSEELNVVHVCSRMGSIFLFHRGSAGRGSFIKYINIDSGKEYFVVDNTLEVNISDDPVISCLYEKIGWIVDHHNGNVSALIKNMYFQN